MLFVIKLEDIPKEYDFLMGYQLRKHPDDLFESHEYAINYHEKGGTLL